MLWFIFKSCDSLESWTIVIYLEKKKFKIQNHNTEFCFFREYERKLKIFFPKRHKLSLWNDILYKRFKHRINIIIPHVVVVLCFPFHICVLCAPLHLSPPPRYKPNFVAHECEKRKQPLVYYCLLIDHDRQTKYFLHS